MTTFIIPKCNIWTPPSKWQRPWVGDIFPWLQKGIIQLATSSHPHATAAAGAGGGGNPTPQLSPITQSDIEFGTATCSWNIQRDGDLQLTQPSFQTRTNEWLLSGDKASTIGDDYQGRLTKTAGSNPAMTNWTLGAYSTISNTKTCTLTAVVGTSSFDGTLTIRETANTSNNDSASVSMDVESIGNGGCPFCCFHPDTLIEVPGGFRPIKKIHDGDTIMTFNGEGKEPTVVSEPIVRENVPMFYVSFNDGRKLLMSADHPLHTEEGPASISRQPYKDLGTPAKLRVGSLVLSDRATWLQVTNIQRSNYKGPVITFQVSMFYANGILAY